MYHFLQAAVMAGTEGERSWDDLEWSTFMLCLALVQGSHMRVLKMVLHCTGLCQTYPEVGCLTQHFQDAFDQDKLINLTIYLAKLYCARPDIDAEQMCKLIDFKPSEIASAVRRLACHFVVFQIAERKDRSEIKKDLEILQGYLPPPEQDSFLKSALEFADQQGLFNATTQDIRKRRMSHSTPMKAQTPGGLLQSQQCLTPLSSKLDYGVHVSPILEVNDTGVPFLFSTPSVNTSFDVSSEISVFKTATSGSGTGMSFDVSSHQKVKKRSGVTSGNSGTSMSSGMSKRAKKRSSITSDASSGTSMSFDESSDVSKKAKRTSSCKISNSGKNTSDATNNSSSGTSTEAGKNTSDATNDSSSSGNSTKAGKNTSDATNDSSSSGNSTKAGKNTSDATNDSSSSGNSTKAGKNTSDATNDCSSNGNSTEAGSVSLRSFGQLLVMVLGSKAATIKDCLKEIAHLREKAEAGQALSAEQICLCWRLCYKRIRCVFIIFSFIIFLLFISVSSSMLCIKTFFWFPFFFILGKVCKQYYYQQ